MKLSIIIPVYNVEQYLQCCVQSVITQTYQNLQVILVNDGSTDSSGILCDQLAQQDSRIQVVHKENGGLSDARNAGIDIAKGKYISFIDADDYIVGDGLEKIINIAEEYKADVVKFKNIGVTECDDQDKSSVANFPINIVKTTGDGVLNRYDISDYIVWDGIYRRSLILDHNIRFMTDLCLREDDTFMGMLYCHANIVIATDLPLYRYVSASNFSSTHNQPVEKQRRLIYSNLNAMRYRCHYVAKHKPNVMNLERLKYMRWVCSISSAISAQLTLREYLILLDEFRKEGVYPLEYAWIKVAGWNYSWKIYLKRVLQTFLINHPRIGYVLVRFYRKFRYNNKS